MRATDPRSADRQAFYLGLAERPKSDESTPFRAGGGRFYLTARYTVPVKTRLMWRRSGRPGLRLVALRHGWHCGSRLGRAAGRAMAAGGRELVVA